MRRDWGLLQLALLERWPSDNDETSSKPTPAASQPQAPFAAPTGSSTSNGYVETLPPGHYAIRNVSTKKVLDLEGAWTNPGNTIFLYASHGGQNQVWSFLPGKQGFKIRNGVGPYMGFAWGVQPVACAAISGNPDGPEWKIQQHGDYYLIVLASNPSLVLDLSEAHSNNGNKVIAYPRTGESSQG